MKITYKEGKTKCDGCGKLTLTSYIVLHFIKKKVKLCRVCYEELKHDCNFEDFLNSMGIEMIKGIEAGERRLNAVKNNEEMSPVR